jgi:hypothetical protein
VRALIADALQKRFGCVNLNVQRVGWVERSDTQQPRFVIEASSAGFATQPTKLFFCLNTSISVRFLAQHHEICAESCASAKLRA